MAMFTIDFGDELRAAFNAGRASMLPKELGKVPRTYEQWLAERQKRPTTVRG